MPKQSPKPETQPIQLNSALLRYFDDVEITELENEFRRRFPQGEDESRDDWDQRCEDYTVKEGYNRFWWDLPRSKGVWGMFIKYIAEFKYTKLDRVRSLSRMAWDDLDQEDADFIKREFLHFARESKVQQKFKNHPTLDPEPEKEEEVEETQRDPNQWLDEVKAILVNGTSAAQNRFNHLINIQFKAQLMNILQSEEARSLITDWKREALLTCKIAGLNLGAAKIMIDEYVRICQKSVDSETIMLDDRFDKIILGKGKELVVATYVCSELRHLMRWCGDKFYYVDPISKYWVAGSHHDCENMISRTLVQHALEYKTRKQLQLDMKLLDKGEEDELNENIEVLDKLINSLSGGYFVNAVLRKTKHSVKRGGLNDPDFEKTFGHDAVIPVTDNFGQGRYYFVGDELTYGQIDPKCQAIDRHFPVTIPAGTSGLVINLDNNAAYARVDDTMSKIMGEYFKKPEERTRTRALQRILGYCITGWNTAKAFFVFLGESGNNGKSFIQRLMIAVMGDYACAADKNVFVKGGRSNEGGPASHIMQLTGKRCVFAPEPGKNQTLNDELLKAITGGDPISARELHGTQQSFYLDCKLVMFTNYHLLFDVQQKAMIERLIEVPCLSSFVKDLPLDRESDETRTYRADDSLLKEVESGSSYRGYVLGWLLNGACEYAKFHSKEAFNHPDFAAARESYIEQIDPVGQFIKEKLEATKNPKDKVGVTDMYGEFQTFCMEEGISDRDRPNKSSFGKIMEAKFEKKKISTMHYVGVRLVQPDY